jgi:hypothetical protein
MHEGALVTHMVAAAPGKARLAPLTTPPDAEPPPLDARVMLDHAPAVGPPGAENLAPAMLASERAGRIELCEVAPSAFDEARHSAAATADGVQPTTEQATSSTQKTTASGQHYG